MLVTKELLEFSRYKQKGDDKDQGDNSKRRSNIRRQPAQQQRNPARNQLMSTKQNLVIDLDWVMSVRGITERCELG